MARQVAWNLMTEEPSGNQRESEVGAAVLESWYRAEGAYRVCEEDSGVHCPVGAGALEQAVPRKAFRPDRKYPPDPSAWSCERTRAV